MRNAAWTYDLRLATYAGPMVDSSGLDTHMAPSKEVVTADFFKRKVSNDTTSTVSKDMIETESLKKIMDFEKKIPRFMLYKMTSKFTMPRIEILDIVYGHIR